MSISDNNQAVARTLADLYRPQRLADVVGQEAIVETLKVQISTGTLQPTLLFEGDPGIGKTTLARIVARSLNCTASDGPTIDPCGECSGCLSLEGQDAHLDIVELNCGEHSGIDSIRELAENFQLRPLSARVKVVIFDEFQLLSGPARQVLTKPLETPPVNTVFIITTTDVGAVPPAIRSRSQHFRLQPIPREAIAQRITLVAAEVGMAIGADAVQEIARASRGSLRTALIVLGQFVGLVDEVTRDLVRRCLPAIGEESLLAMLTALVENNPLALLKALAALEDDRRNAADLTPALGEMLHNLFLVEVLPPADLHQAVSCSAEMLLSLQALQGQRSPQTIHHWYTLLVDAFTPGSRLVRDDVALEMTLLRMIYEGAAPAAAMAGPGPAAIAAAPLTIKEEPRAIAVPQVQLSAEEQAAVDAAASLEQQIGWAAVAGALTSSGAKSALRATKLLGFADGVLTLSLRSAAFARHQDAVEAAVLAACTGVTSCVWEA